MAQILGIALWALIPGFVAKKKGRNFWGWYFLSFLISPLITMIITFCLSNLNKFPENTKKPDSEQMFDNEEATAEEKVTFCRKCGNKLLDGAQFCNKCGTAIVKED